jgi:uracil-DNA glycosylase
MTSDGSYETVVKSYQQKIWKTYKQEVGVLQHYNYLYGNPVKVHVPIDTTCNSLMIIGAYPTAHFNVIGSQTDVPVADHLYPFSNEKYFDGASVREVKSGAEIETYILNELGIKRTDCWITDLVKVFLFKEGHIKKYEAIDCKGHVETRSKFMEYAKVSKQYIDEEIAIAQPKVILGLGTEVNQVMLNLSAVKAQKQMEEGLAVNYLSNGKKYVYFPVAHPGILMREDRNEGYWNKALRTSLAKIRADHFELV